MLFVPPLRLPKTTTSVPAIGLAIALGVLAAASNAAGPKNAPRQPELKIVSVDAAPLPFFLNEKSLTLTIVVELPKVLPGDALLNVTTLITSPSRSSIRVLENRQILTDKVLTDARLEAGKATRITLVQMWDGTDHTKSIVSEGIYDYQVQAKLMATGKNGPVTKETSWRKRGTLEVRSR